MSFQIKPVFLALTVLCVLSLGHSRVEAQISKYHSSWVADERYENIQFKFTRQKDPGGSKNTELYKYGYKNNSSTDWRVSYEITGAGLKSPHVGAVVVRAGKKKSDAWTMFLDTDPGGELKSRIISLTELGDFGKRRKTIVEGFDELNSEVSPKEAKELSNKEISRILNDNREQVLAKARHHRNVIENGNRNFSTSRQGLANTQAKKRNDGVKPDTENQKNTGGISGDVNKRSKNSMQVVDQDAWIDLGGSRVYISSDGTAKQMSSHGTWSYSGNTLRINLVGRQVNTGQKTNERTFEGTLQEENEYIVGKRQLIFLGTRTDTSFPYGKRGSSSVKERRVMFYPDG